MEMKLHRLATTTPATRMYIQTSNKSARPCRVSSGFLCRRFTSGGGPERIRLTGCAMRITLNIISSACFDHRPTAWWSGSIAV